MSLRARARKTMARRIGSIHALTGTSAPQNLQDVESWSTPLPQFLQNGRSIPYNTTKVIVELKFVEDMPPKTGQTTRASVDIAMYCLSCRKNVEPIEERSHYGHRHVRCPFCGWKVCLKPRARLYKQKRKRFIQKGHFGTF